MAEKEYSLLTRIPELEPQHQLQFSIPPRTFRICGLYLSINGYTQLILSFGDITYTKQRLNSLKQQWIVR